MKIPNSPLMITMINVLIIALLALVGWLTMNPLVILGLFLLQQVPVLIGEGGQMVDAMGEGIDPDEPIPNATENRIGFHAELRN